MGGLCAARALARRGDVEVVVYERAGRPGGVLHTSRADGFVREHAANAFLPVREGDGALDLAGELGVEVAEAAPEAKKRWIYRKGALHALPSGPRQLLTTGLLSWRGKLALLGEPLRPRRRRAGQSSEHDESVFDFVARRLGHEVAEAVVAPFVTGVFAGNADELSVEAGFPALVALEEQGGLLVGQLRTMLRRRREARKSSPGQDLGQGSGRSPGHGQIPGRRASRLRMAAPVGGVQALVDALAAELGDSLITGAHVKAVVAGQGGPRLCFGDGSERAVSAVVLATPAYASAELVADLSPELSAVLRGIPYAPIAIAYLGARRADIAHPLDGFGFLVARGEELRMLGAVFESVLWNDRAPADHVLLRCMFGGARDPAAMDLDDQALLDTARADLDRALGGFAGARLVHSHVVRWPRAIAQYTLGHGERVARAESLAQPLGIVLAGSAYHGVAVNRIVADARRVAGAVMARLGAAAAVLLAVLSALALAGGLSACAGGNKAAPDGLAAEDAPASDPSGAAAGLAPGDDSQPGNAGDGGRVAVQVTWPDAPAALRRPAGRNPCGAWRPAPVHVHTLGGVAGAVVELRGVADRAEPARALDSKASPTEMAMRSCSLEPRVALLPGAGAELAIRNDDDRRHAVTIAPASGAAVYRAELPLLGSQVALPMNEPGIWRLSAAVDAGASAVPAWLIVPAHSHTAMTDEQGAVRFERVPAGAYEAVVWHPPVAPGQRAIEARKPVSVTTGQTTSLTLALRSP
jgi:oxygen-dependent protoporphyrinogen oxidase